MGSITRNNNTFTLTLTKNNIWYIGFLKNILNKIIHVSRFFATWYIDHTQTCTIIFYVNFYYIHILAHYLTAKNNKYRFILVH